MNLVFLGPPGVGKGTIAVMAAEHLRIPHISTGDLFRDNIRNGTDLGKQVKQILDSGELVPDEVTIEMVRQRLQQEDASGGFILDGFPRTVAQADALGTITQVDHAVNFTAPKDIIIRRLSGRRVAKNSGKIYHLETNPPKVPGKCDITGEPIIQRPDDTEEAIDKRLTVYHQQSAPLVGYYRDLGLLREVDASTDPESIFNEFLRRIS